MERKGRYMRYASVAKSLTGLVIANVAYLCASAIDTNYIAAGWKVTWLIMNVAYLPEAVWLANSHTPRSIHIDRIAIKALQVVVVHALCFLALMAFLEPATADPSFYVWFYSLFAAFLPLAWIVVRLIDKRLQRHGRNNSIVVIVGYNDTAQRLRDEMMADAGYGYRIAGFFDDTSQAPEVIGKIRNLPDYLVNNTVHEIYYTLDSGDTDMLSSLVALADEKFARFYLVPQLSRFVGNSVRLDNIGTVPVLGVRNNPLSHRANRIMKRMFDLSVSSVALLLSPIVFLPIAAAIKLTSPGPIFFKQLRTGYHGKEFMCWKFRTMCVNTSANDRQTSRNDNRITPLGRWLRHTSIDELPQFINVWRGDMSIVGPRPHMTKQTHLYSSLIDRYMVRHFIKPGITGWAQVQGLRGSTEALWQMEQRVQADVWYIENWNFMLDMKIIFLTAINALRGDRNAF